MVELYKMQLYIYIRYLGIIGYVDVLVQERHNSIANALELRLSCTNLLM